jgi:hypothetical protein
MGDRIRHIQQEPKDWGAFYADCFNDVPIYPVIELVNMLYQAGHTIVFCTGRREQARNKTETWLSYVGLPYSAVLMRKNEDIRPDTIVKPELIREAGVDFADITYVIEDRNSLVAEWRRLGLTVLQPAEGNF